jgi:hypothetical protein
VVRESTAEVQRLKDRRRKASIFSLRPLRSCYILAAFAVSLIGIVAAIEGLDIWPLSRSSRLPADPVRGIVSPFNLWVANAVFFAIRDASSMASIAPKLPSRPARLELGSGFPS